jgi:5-methyltetrahydrofolate--homocysteine methyltransferase
MKAVSKPKLYFISGSTCQQTKIDWATTTFTKPQFTGRKEFVKFPLEEIRKYIDWTPFFQTWMLAGRFPGILKDEVVGVEATKLI